MANYKTNKFCPQHRRDTTVRPQTDSHELVNVHSLVSSVAVDNASSWLFAWWRTGQLAGSHQPCTATREQGNRQRDNSGRKRLEHRRARTKKGMSPAFMSHGVIREHQRTRAKEGAKGQENDFFRTNIKKRWLQVSYSQQKRVNLQTGTHYDLNHTIRNEATPHHGISHCLSPQPC